MPKTATTRKSARTAKKPARTRSSARRKKPVKKWSGRVTATSDALDLKHEVFKQRSASAIAGSLKRSAERSHRRKSSPYRSAMSMLVFYINRAGNNLSASRRQVLENTKGELRKAFGKELNKPG
jgi:hypothetical protein